MRPKSTSEKNPQDWFDFGAERLRAADSLWKHEGLTPAGIELLQESVERYLKGYLVAKGWTLVKTHDLERLLKEAVGFNSAFAQFKTSVAELTEEFFAQHYPGEDLTDVGKNYESLRQQAGEMVHLIQKSLPQFFQNIDL